jgi:hypothetical protein
VGGCEDKLSPDKFEARRRLGEGSCSLWLKFSIMETVDPTIAGIEISSTPSSGKQETLANKLSFEGSLGKLATII